jgi:hypothetical protein
MKKITIILVKFWIVSSLSFGQSTTILSGANSLHILKTGNSSMGFNHTNGIIGVGTYVGNVAGWVQTHSNHPLYFATNNGNAQMSLTTNGRLGIGIKTPATTLEVLSSVTNVAKFSSAVNQSYLIFYQNTVSPTGYVGTFNDFANNSFEIGTTTVFGRLFLNTFGTNSVTVTPKGYIKLGNYEDTDVPALKTKKMTGITAATEGASVSIVHGLSSSKILGVKVLVEAFGEGGFIPEGCVGVGGGFIGCDYNFIIDSTNIVITNSSTNSENILSLPLRILITYEE